MQKRTVKILLLIIPLFLACTSSKAQVSQYRLQQADSLFAAKRYTSALAKYEGVISNNEYSPALLLKMAYLHEALGHVAKTQYFLSLYFLSTNHPSVLEKMEALATKNNLQGYAVSDKERALLIYRRFETIITATFVSLLILSQAWFLYKKRPTQKRPIAAFVIQLLVCGLLVTHLYLTSHNEASILMRPNTYLMSGPSAGADVVEVINEGHRLTITGKKDVWVKVRWNDRDAFVKEGFLQPIVL
jgi:hypothetical protein